jgi:type IX secretion system PorP/SprF family membrane protein
MRRTSICILIILIPIGVFGQLFPLSDHYAYNALSINPAYAGCHEALSTTISYRNQWVGFKDSPKSYTLSLHAPVFNDRVGLGLLVDNSSLGIFKETSFIANYAYRMALREGKLALGLGFGVTLSNIAWNELNATDEGDQQLIYSPATEVLPTFSLGAYYYTKKLYIGISLPMFFRYELDRSRGKYLIINNFPKSNYLFSVGYDVNISKQVKLLPALLIKYRPGNIPQIDYNAQLAINDRIWFGIGYRNNGILMGMLQFQLNYQIRMAYSYDFDLGGIGKYADGSHEIVLNYIFRYSRKVTGPRQF